MVAHWVGQKCGPAGNDRSRHAGIYAMLQWLAGGQVCLNLCPWMMSHGGRTFEMCQLPFVSGTSPLHAIYISLFFNFADQAACFRWQASIFQL